MLSLNGHGVARAIQRLTGAVLFHDRAGTGAEAPQPQPQQQAQPSGELSDNGEENTAPQPQPNDAGADSGEALHCEGACLVCSTSLVCQHFVCSCAQCSAATASQQVDMLKACNAQRLLSDAASSSHMCGARPDVTVFAGAGLQVQQSLAAEPSQAETVAATQERVQRQRAQGMQRPRA